MTDLVSAPLDAEDAKLMTLARGARARVGSAEGAAVRDETGRTYSAAGVALPALTLSSIELVVATAVSSGARRIDCVVVVRDGDTLGDVEDRLLRDLGGAVLILCSADGTVRDRREIPSL